MTTYKAVTKHKFQFYNNNLHDTSVLATINLWLKLFWDSLHNTRRCPHHLLVELKAHQQPSVHFSTGPTYTVDNNDNSSPEPHEAFQVVTVWSRTVHLSPTSIIFYALEEATSTGCALGAFNRETRSLFLLLPDRSRYSRSTEEKKASNWSNTNKYTFCRLYYYMSFLFLIPQKVADPHK